MTPNHLPDHNANTAGTGLCASFNAVASTMREKCGISAAVLKWIAVVTMFIDHFGATVLNRLKYSSAVIMSPDAQQRLAMIYKYSRRIGRLAFPLYCFMIVEGYLHTRNVKKYALRLAVFALISEFPFDFALHYGQPFMNKQNVYWTLLVGLLVIWAVDELFRGKIAIQLIIMITALFFVTFLKTDYNYHGVFLIELLYIMKYSRFWQSACSAAYLQYYEKMPTPFASLLCFLYNGKRGRQPKYFFYLFYPLHLMFLGVLSYYILPAAGIVK